MEHGPQDIQNNDNLTLFAFALATAIVSAATAGLIIGFYKVCKWSFTFARLIKDYVLTALLVRQALFADTRKVLLELESYVLCDIAQRNKRNLYQLAANQSYQSS